MSAIRCPGLINPARRLTDDRMCFFQCLMRLGVIAWTSLILLLAPGVAQALLPAANTGNLYVSMWISNEIAVFKPDGSAMGRFTVEGLRGPRGIAFNPNNGEIWVAAEFSNAVYVFDAEHRLLRTVTHPDFDEPVGVTFITSTAAGSSELEVVISNSNGNELMVFSPAGQLLRRFTDETLNDPNCSAVMSDGTLFVANRLGGSTGASGSVARFNADDQFQFDFTADGIGSLMAVARNPRQADMDEDDTLWISSGGGSLGIHEFDQSGNLLQSVLPADIDDARPIVPQGLSVDEAGQLYVVSFTGEVLVFDSDTLFLRRFDTGTGTPRSSAFAICPMNCSDEGAGGTPLSSSSGSGWAGWILITLLAGFGAHRRAIQTVVSHPVSFAEKRQHSDVIG